MPGKQGRSKNASVSMTGFGKGSAESADVAIEVELRSVNHRFLDLSFRLPRVYNVFEGELREALQKKIERGRVEIFVTRTPKSASAVKLEFNEALFDSYYRLGQGVLTKHGHRDAGAESALLIDLLRNREIVSFFEGGIEVKNERSVLLSAFTQATDALFAVRAAEGARLSVALERELGDLRKIYGSIHPRAACTPAAVRERLNERLKGLAPEIIADPARLSLEVTLLADRADVSEEITRIASHLEVFTETLGVSPQGRKLDFLVQELFREFNTINSKCQDSEVQHLVVEAKVLLEKMREQIQNVE